MLHPGKGNHNMMWGLICMIMQQIQLLGDDPTTNIKADWDWDEMGMILVDFGPFLTIQWPTGIKVIQGPSAHGFKVI